MTRTKPALRRRGDRAARVRRADRRGADPRLSRPRRRARVGQGLEVARTGAGAGAGPRRRPRRAARPAGRSADRDQGHHRHRRHADRARLADLSRQPAVRRRRLRRAVAHGRRHDHGENGDDRVRQPLSGRNRQPAQPGAHARRLVERLGGGGCRFPGAGGARHADRRLGDPPVGVLRRRRLQAELRRIQPQRHQAAMPQPRHARHSLPRPRRHAAAARRDTRRTAPRHRPQRVGAAHRPVPHPRLGARRRARRRR